VRVIHNFGWADEVDADALRRLISSISRFLSPSDQVAACHGGSEAAVEMLESQRLGAAWVLDPLWGRLGIASAIRRVASKRMLDAGAIERILLTLVAQRACEPASKLEATRWVAQRVFIAGAPGFCDDAAYRSMDFLLTALAEVAEEVFSSVAHLLNLDVSVVFETPPRRTGRSKPSTCVESTRMVTDRRWETRSAGASRRPALVCLGLARHHLPASPAAHPPTPCDRRAGVPLPLHPEGQPVTKARLVRAAGLRWPIETDFAFGKDSFGLDECQARLYTTIARHIVFVMAALGVCAVTAALLGGRTDTQARAPVRPDEPTTSGLGMIPLNRPGDRTPARRSDHPIAPAGTHPTLVCLAPAPSGPSPLVSQAHPTRPRHHVRPGHLAKCGCRTGHSGSSSAKTGRPPPGTPPCASGSSSTWPGSSRA
jgi:uridylate kinase